MIAECTTRIMECEEWKSRLPNRSESAPPSVEGSLMSFSSIFSRKNLCANSEFEELSTLDDGILSEERMRSDPSYLAYYSSNINLNPRLPPPLVSKENRRLVHHITDSDERKSKHDCRMRDFYFSEVSLATHKVEPEKEGSSEEDSQKESVVDLIQEGVPPRMYNQSHTASIASDVRKLDESCGDDSPVRNGCEALTSRVRDWEIGESDNSQNSPSCDTSNFHQGLHMKNGMRSQLASDVNAMPSMHPSYLNLPLCSLAANYMSYGPLQYPLFQSPGFPAPVFGYGCAPSFINFPFAGASSAEGKLYGEQRWILSPYYDPFQMHFFQNLNAECGETHGEQISHSINDRCNKIKRPSSGANGKRVSVTNARFVDSEKHGLLEELRASKCQNVELPDIAGHVVEFCMDQHGSRLIQEKLERCCDEQKASVFNEILPFSSNLMVDVFGNYVIQKFLEYGNPNQQRKLADKLRGQMLHLCLQMYGCRVIQKALEVIDLHQKRKLVQELDGHVLTCVYDQNGNHVIQKCIECMPGGDVGFIISAFRGHVLVLSTHPYGCRVVQRALEHCLEEARKQRIIEEVLAYADVLSQDQYGNYVTQHVLERGKPQERSEIISKLKGKFVEMSQHKYASNVVEKCLEYGDDSERVLLKQEIVGDENLLTLMKDRFGNYVIQKVLDIGSDEDNVALVNHVRSHFNELKKFPFGKHIVARMDQIWRQQECNAL